MKNPVINGVILVKTEGKKRGTECYNGPSRTSVPYKVFTSLFKKGFNPKKIVFFGEEITIYAKNMTLKFNLDGTVETLPVDAWDAKGNPKVAEDIIKYGLKQ